MAAPNPSANVNVSNIQTLTIFSQVNKLNPAAANSIQLCVISSNFRLSMMSATAPAGSPSSKTGKLVATCSKATSSGEVVSEGINQAASTFCIQTPMSETSAAIMNARNIEFFSGVQAEVVTEEDIIANDKKAWSNNNGI